MDVDLFSKLPPLALVSVLNQVLVRSGRERTGDNGNIGRTGSGLVMIVQQISDLFELVKTLFNL